MTFSQRNVVLIIADDLSPDFFGFYEGYGDTVDVPLTSEHGKKRRAI